MLCCPGDRLRTLQWWKNPKSRAQLGVYSTTLVGVLTRTTEFSVVNDRVRPPSPARKEILQSDFDRAEVVLIMVIA